MRLSSRGLAVATAGHAGDEPHRALGVPSMRGNHGHPRTQTPCGGLRRLSSYETEELRTRASQVVLTQSDNHSGEPASSARDLQGVCPRRPIVLACSWVRIDTLKRLDTRRWLVKSRHERLTWGFGDFPPCHA